MEFVLEGDPEATGDSGFLAVGEATSSSLRYEQWQNTLQMGFTQGGVADYSFVPGVPSPSIATHVAYVWDATAFSMRIYVNGVMSGEAIGVSDLFVMPSGMGYLGANPSGTEAMIGRIYRVAVYDEKVPEATLQKHAKAFTSVLRPPIIASFTATPHRNRGTRQRGPQLAGRGCNRRLPERDRRDRPYEPDGDTRDDHQLHARRLQQRVVREREGQGVGDALPDRLRCRGRRRPDSRTATAGHADEHREPDGFGGRRVRLRSHRGRHHHGVHHGGRSPPSGRTATWPWARTPRATSATRSGRTHARWASPNSEWRTICSQPAVASPTVPTLVTYVLGLHRPRDQALHERRSGRHRDRRE